MNTERKLVVVGAGRIGTGLLRLIPSHWSVTVVDVDPARLAALPERVTQVVGDASSRLVLAKCSLQPSVTLVLVTADDAVNLEAARLARDEFGVQDVIAILDEPCQGLDAVVRSDAVVGHLRARIGGLDGAGATGRGELMQVPVLAGSPAIGRRLRELRRGGWLVAMIYRGDDLVVPHGDAVVAEGDRVLLAGRPAELEGVATFFRGGMPTFPAAWGARIGYVGAAAKSAALWLGEKTTAAAVVEIPSALLDPAVTSGDALRERLQADEIGCLVVGPTPISWAARLGITRSRIPAHLRAAQVPVLITRGDAAPSRVVVAVGPEHDVRVIAGAGIDLARQVGAPLSLLTVLPPTISNDSPAATDVTRDVIQFARLHGVEPERRVERGNPIERVRALCLPGDLLVIGHGSVRRNSVLTPDVSLFFIDDAPGPVLLVPWSR